MTGPDRQWWRGRRVVVAGAGVSGAAALRVLRDLGADVTVADRDTARADELGVAVEDLAAPPPGTDLVVTSPGWRPDSPLLVAARAADIPVWGEVELAWQLRGPDAAPWLAVTGTNGKTTTVRMLTAMLQAAGHRAVAAGNVGTPVLDAVLADPPYDVLAVELSSFQLHWSSSLRPHAATILNLADDHVDWHGSYDDYALAKHRIWHDPVNRLGRLDTGDGPGWVTTLIGHTTPKLPVAVGNADDAFVTELLQMAWAERKVSFTLGTPGVGQLGVVEDLLVDRAFVDDPVHGAEELATVADVRPAGPHNVANALAAAALARAYGVPAAAVREGLRSYTPDPHRNALVAEVAGVSYVDDSKATNPHAADAALSGYRSVVWVAGGLLKGADVTDLVRAHAHHLRAAVLIGRDRAEIAAALARHAPEVRVVEVSTTDTGAMSEVVEVARALAQPGDTVLLAPAAASMDMFVNYGARGDAFAAAVRDLAGRDSA